MQVLHLHSHHLSQTSFQNSTAHTCYCANATNSSDKFHTEPHKFHDGVARNCLQLIKVSSSDALRAIDLILMLCFSVGSTHEGRTNNRRS